MPSLQSLLTSIFSHAFEQSGCESRFGQVVESQRPDLCQFQCNGALAAAKTLKKNPREVAQAIVALVSKNDCVKNLSIAGPGFINFNAHDSFLAQHLNSVAPDTHLGCTSADESAAVIVDYGGPNVAKPMHVGHLRSAIIGQCFCNVFRFLGYRVVADNQSR